MRQAIVTKYLGSRIKATAAAGSLTVNWDHSLGVDQNHMAAAEALVRKLGWTSETAKGYAGLWVAGGLPSEAGNVFVYTGEGFSGDGWPLGTAFEV